MQNCLQVFELPDAPQTWSRYILLRFVSHHGSEAACTVNSVRIFGTTEAEDLEAELNALEVDPLAALPLLHLPAGGRAVHSTTGSATPPSGMPHEASVPAVDSAAQAEHTKPPRYEPQANLGQAATVTNAHEASPQARAAKRDAMPSQPTASPADSARMAGTNQPAAASGSGDAADPRRVQNAGHPSIDHAVPGRPFSSDGMAAATAPNDQASADTIKQAPKQAFVGNVLKDLAQSDPLVYHAFNEAASATSKSEASDASQQAHPVAGGVTDTEQAREPSGNHYAADGQAKVHSTAAEIHDIASGKQTAETRERAAADDASDKQVAGVIQAEYAAGDPTQGSAAIKYHEADQQQKAGPRIGDAQASGRRGTRTRTTKSGDRDSGTQAAQHLTSGAQGARERGGHDTGTPFWRTSSRSMSPAHPAPARQPAADRAQPAHSPPPRQQAAREKQLYVANQSAPTAQPGDTSATQNDQSGGTAVATGYEVDACEWQPFSPECVWRDLENLGSSDWASAAAPGYPEPLLYPRIAAEPDSMPGNASPDQPQDLSVQARQRFVPGVHDGQGQRGAMGAPTPVLPVRQLTVGGIGSKTGTYHLMAVTAAHIWGEEVPCSPVASGCACPSMCPCAL